MSNKNLYVERGGEGNGWRLSLLGGWAEGTAGTKALRWVGGVEGHWSHTQAGVLVTNSASVFLDEPKNYLITEASSVLNLKCGTKRNVIGDRISFKSKARRQELSVSSKFRIVGQE